METAFDDLYKTKKEETRKEKIPVVSLLHQVPKQVADTAQAVGVSEKFLANGIPSGVLGPSQIAHDRYLAFMDGIQDAFWASLLLVMLPFVSLNLFTIPVYLAAVLYWTFHVYWWEKGKSWYLKTSTIRYINATYRSYWISFFLVSSLMMGGLIYVFVRTAIEMSVQSALNSFLDVVEGLEKALHASFPDAPFSATPEYFVQITENAYDYRFFVGLSVFFIITLIIKFIFAKSAARERIINLETTDAELEYAGETALRNLRKFRR